MIELALSWFGQSDLYSALDWYTSRPSMAKVTVYVDDQVWSKFRSSVFERRGSLKGLSRDVEESLKSSLVEEDVLPYLEELKASLHPKTRARPEGRGTTAGRQIRALRRRRSESISGH